MSSKFSIFAKMKRIVLLMAALILFVAADNPAYDRYIATYSSLAVSEMHRSGVPASITLAQGILESNAGQSMLAVQARNHFGIKCHNDWRGSKFYQDDDAKNECFRVYKLVEESFRDHSDFLRFQDRYKSLFDLDPTDYKGWARGLRKAGYATDPQYADKLIRIIEENALQRFDTDEQIPVSPAAVEEAKVLKLEYKEEYRFALTRSIYEHNGVPFVYAIEGETFASIARDNNLFLREILAFNELSAARPLVKGEVIYLHAKKNKAAPGIDKYVVGADGESLRDICQRYAVKMSAVRRMNKLSKTYVPAEGDTIRLR